MTDELLDQPGRFPVKLVPYRCGLPCWHQLSAEATQAREAIAVATAQAEDVPVSA